MSTKQTNAKGAEYRNEAERFLLSDMPLAPLIRGIESTERIQQYWNTAHTLNVDENTVEMIQDRMQYLKEREQ